MSALFLGFETVGRTEDGLGLTRSIALVGLVVELSDFGRGQVGVVPQVVGSAVVVVVLGDGFRPGFVHIQRVGIIKRT